MFLPKKLILIYSTYLGFFPFSVSSCLVLSYFVMYCRLTTSTIFSSPLPCFLSSNLLSNPLSRSLSCTGRPRNSYETDVGTFEGAVPLTTTFFRYSAVHYTKVHYITLHYTTLHYTTSTAVPFVLPLLFSGPKYAPRYLPQLTHSLIYSLLRLHSCVIVLTLVCLYLRTCVGRAGMPLTRP